MPSKSLRPPEKEAKNSKKASLTKQTIQKTVQKTKEVTKKGKPPVQSPEPSATSGSDSEEGSESEQNSEDDDDESEDIDEAGMQRLMKHFQGEELDDIAKYQLGALGEEEDEEDEEIQDEDGDSNAISEDEEENEDEEDDEDEEVEEDDDDEEEDTLKPQKSSTSNAQLNGTAITNLIEEVEEVDLEDASSVDEDAVVRQKIVINNKVYSEIYLSPLTNGIGLVCFGTDTTDHTIGPIPSMDRNPDRNIQSIY
jgi:hypothetical protein